MQKTHTDFKSSVRTLINYLKEDKKTYCIGIIISVIVGILDFAGVSSLIPAIALFLGEETSAISPIFSKYIQSVNLPVVGVVFASLILIQTALNLFGEIYFLKKMAAWRTNLSIDYIRGISYSEWNGLGKIQPGEMEVMLTRNIAISITHSAEAAFSY